MTLLVGLINLGGRVFWQVTQADDPGVLTMAFPEQIVKNSEVPDVSPPRSIGESGPSTSTPCESTWTHRLLTTFLRGPEARSEPHPPRREGRCASTSRRRCSGRLPDG
jgi:hypothetical protein